MPMESWEDLLPTHLKELINQTVDEEWVLFAAFLALSSLMLTGAGLPTDVTEPHFSSPDLRASMRNGNGWESGFPRNGRAPPPSQVSPTRSLHPIYAFLPNASKDG